MSVSERAEVRSATERYLAGDDLEKALGLLSILDEDGNVSPADVGWIEREQALSLFRGMLQIREVDARLMKLQRQGRIGFYGEALGQEAAVVGTAAALEPGDWLVPALREAGAGLYRGMPLRAYVAQIFGNAHDVCKGRQMPCHPSDLDTRYVPMSSCVASQVPHAVGIGMAMAVRGDEGRICIGYMGDGGTSEADFHVALNFAGVFKARTVLVCQNNQWAISTPAPRQTASETIAVKGVGYGVESLRADGNDVFAVYQVARYAADKARRGGGPTLIELLTYRVGAHSSSDDPSRYRDESVTEEWRTRRDPLRRMEAFLSRRGWLATKQRAQLEEEIAREVNDVVAEEERVGPPAVETLVEDVYAEAPWHLEEQRGELMRERTKRDGK